ncbi:MAG: ATP-binding protein [Betaproteobacteria bacterium]
MPCRKGKTLTASEKPVLRVTCSVPARLPAFEEVRALIEQFAAAAGLVREDRHKLTLIVEELFTNTVNHGGKGEALVVVTLEEDVDYLRLIFEDTASQFDPLAAGGLGDPTTSITERRVGGLGLFLALGLTQHADYSYADGRNRLRLRFTPTRS